MLGIGIKCNMATLLKLLLIAALIIMNVAIFNHRSNSAAAGVITINDVDIGTEVPTDNVIPTNTKQYHVEHVIQGRFDERSDRIQKICSIPGHAAAGVTKPNDLIDFPSLGLLWCPIFKAGSSNWLDLFCKNNVGHPVDDGCNIRVIRKNNAAAPFLNKPYFNYNAMMQETLGTPFMTVRHPMTRFLSAYRNKIELVPNYVFYVNIGQDAVANYREIDNEKYSEAEKKELLVEANDVIKSKGHHEYRNNSFDNPYLNPPGPTFGEFVKWAIHGGMDNHIKPFYIQCAPCTIDYTVLRLEKMNEESDYLFSKIERSYLNLDFRSYLNVHGRTDECMLRYYNSLPRNDLQELFDQFFAVDCDLYSYPCQYFIETVMGMLPAETNQDIRC